MVRLGVGSAAFCVYRLACGPLNNMTPAVATGRLLFAPPCVGTAFCVYRLACGPLNNLTWGCLGGGGCVGTARWFGRCPHKAVHTEGGLWPPQESCYLRGHRQGGTHKTLCLHRRCTQKAPQEPCSFKGLRRGLCFLKRHMGWGGYRNEPAVWPAGPPPGGPAGRTTAEFFGRGPPPSLTTVSFR